VYIYYQSYEAREQLVKRRRQRRAKLIIQRAFRARRARRGMARNWRRGWTAGSGPPPRTAAGLVV